MPWLRHALVDVAVTLLVLAATVLGQVWAFWFLVVYTPVLLLMRALVLFVGGLRTFVKRPASAPPVWFVYGLIGINAALLLAYGQWWLGVGWVLIWLLTVAADRRF